MAAVQLNFNLRTSSKCKSVHLAGSWDGYSSNLPLKRDSSKSGSWRGAFQFKSPTLVPGSRYWYYYITDGHHVSHDPSKSSMVEPTTGRILNVLDIPASKHSPSSHGSSSHSSSRNRYGSSGAIKGRSLSPSKIQHPHPSRPYETNIFRSSEMEALSRAYAAQRLVDSDSDSEGSYNRVPSLYSRSSNSSSPSSPGSVGTPTSGSSSPDFSGARYMYPGGQSYGLGISSGSPGSCVCNRTAVMKDGRKFKIDCQGTVCGGSSGGRSSDSSSEDDGRRRRSSKSHGKHHSSGGRREVRIRR